MDQQHFSFTYRILRKSGIYLSPVKYGNFSPWQFFRASIKLWKNEILHKMARGLVIFEPFSSRPIRAMLHRWRGVKIGKGVYIGLEVIFDSVYPEKIHIGDNCIITNKVQILAHNRDLSNYCVGDSLADLDYVVADVIIHNNVAIGVDSLILPGVVIGEGAVIAAKSVVNRDVAEYSMVAGIPAKLVKTFKKKI